MFILSIKIVASVDDVKKLTQSIGYMTPHAVWYNVYNIERPVLTFHWVKHNPYSQNLTFDIGNLGRD